LIPGIPSTVVGVTEDDSAWCNGVLYGVTEEQLKLFDGRETPYTRVPLKPEDVMEIAESDQDMLEGRIWTYVPKAPKSATEEAPIHQRYVDLCIIGCLDISDNFAFNFVTQTKGWKYDILDNREEPVKGTTLAETIDNMVKRDALFTVN